MKKKFPDWSILTAICLVAAILLVVTNMATSGVIAANEAKASMANRIALLPGSETFEDMEDGVSVGKDAAGNILGYAATGSAFGFGGDVETTVVVYPDGTLAGISVGGANFAETSGLGAKAKEPEFQDQFAGKALPVDLKQSGGEIDAITGATITSRAVIKGIGEAVDKMSAQVDLGIAALPAAPEVTVKDGKYSASADGFGGPVKVTLALDETNTVTAIEIGDDKFAETPGLGAKAQEEPFLNQFVGKTLPITMEDIDAISGATITSTAVVTAIDKIAQGKDSAVPEEETAAEEPVAEPAAEPVVEAAKTLTATEEGFGGDIEVTFGVDENNTIVTVDIGGKYFAETPGLGAKVSESPFKDQFIGKTLPIAAEDVDCIAGATISSKAVIRAIEAINKQAAPAEEPAAEPVADAAAPAKTLTATAEGFGGDIEVTFGVDENNTIVTVDIGGKYFAETDGFGGKVREPAFTSQFIGKTLPIAAEDVDCITGATISSKAVIRAVEAINAQVQ